MSLSQQTYAAIKRKIVALEFAPGSVINEASLSDELGVGRTPIRESLQRLERDKLVVILPRRGTFVTDVNLANLSLIYDSRIVLESYIARIASTRGTAAHWRQMGTVLADIQRNEAEASLADLVEADRQCHEIMFAAANHKFLADTLVMLYAQSDCLWHVYSGNVQIMRRAIVEHEAVLVALRQKDGLQASHLIEQHLHTFREEIQAAIIDELKPNT